MKRFVRILSLVFTISFIFSGTQASAASVQDSLDRTAAVDSTVAVDLANDLYSRYQKDTRLYDRKFMSSSSGGVENIFSDIKARLAQYCCMEKIEKYTDRMNSVYKFHEYEPVYAKKDILLKSRVIELTSSSIIVRQFREITDEDTEWGGKGQTYNVVKYIFLENKNGWKLKDILDTRLFIQKPNDVVTCTAYKDVTGDSIKDSIYLIVNKQLPEDLYASSVRVVVNGVSYDLKQDFYSGYGPGLTLCDLDGDQVDDIYISMGTGGSSGASIFYSFSLKDNILKEIFGPGYNSTGLVPLTMKFLDNYRVSVVNKAYPIDTVVDISAGKKYYEEGKMYENGTLKDTEAVPVADPYVSLEPKDIDFDGQFELIGTQYIWGFWHADTLFEFKTTLKYKNGTWILLDYDIKNMSESVSQ